MLALWLAAMLASSVTGNNVTKIKTNFGFYETGGACGEMGNDIACTKYDPDEGGLDIFTQTAVECRRDSACVGFNWSWTHARETPAHTNATTRAQAAHTLTSTHKQGLDRVRLAFL